MALHYFRPARLLVIARKAEPPASVRVCVVIPDSRGVAVFPTSSPRMNVVGRGHVSLLAILDAGRSNAVWGIGYLLM